MKRESLDCKGKTCPWPVFLTKEKLKKMQIGDILEVTVDYAPAKENVERIAITSGNKVLEIKEGNQQYVVVIEKASQK
jgi:TusA-related sulfurtransferase